MEESKGRIAPLFILPVIWGIYYVASQQLIGFTSPLTSGVAIRALTFIILTVLLWRKKELKLLFQIKGVWKRLLLIGTFGFLLDVTSFIGLSLSSAASGTALLKCDVLMVNILSIIIYKQKFTWKAWAGTFVMLFGVFLVMGVDFAHFRIADPGNIFFLLSAFFVSLNAFVIKNVQTDEKNPQCDDVIAYYNNMITLIYFVIAALIFGTLGEMNTVFTDWRAALAMAVASIGQTLVYVVYYYNLRNHPVWLVKICLLLMPVVSTFIMVVLFGESVVLTQYLGIAVIIIGGVVILLDQRSAAKE